MNDPSLTLAATLVAAATAVIGRGPLWGWRARLARLFAHIHFPIGFRYRLVMLMERA